MAYISTVYVHLRQGDEPDVHRQPSAVALKVTPDTNVTLFFDDDAACREWLQSCAVQLTRIAQDQPTRNAS